VLLVALQPISGKSCSAASGFAKAKSGRSGQRVCLSNLYISIG